MATPLQAAREHFNALGVKRHTLLRTDSNHLYLTLASETARREQSAAKLREIGEHLARHEATARQGNQSETFQLRVAELLHRSEPVARTDPRGAIDVLHRYVVARQMRDFERIHPAPEPLFGKTAKKVMGTSAVLALLAGAFISSQIDPKPTGKQMWKPGVFRVEQKLVQARQPDGTMKFVVEGEGTKPFVKKVVEPKPEPEKPPAPEKPAQVTEIVPTFRVLQMPGVTWKEKSDAYVAKYGRTGKRPAPGTRDVQRAFAMTPFGRLVKSKASAGHDEYVGGQYDWEELEPTPENIQAEAQRRLAEARRSITSRNVYAAGSAALTFASVIELGVPLTGEDLVAARHLAKRGPIHEAGVLRTALTRWQPELTGERPAETSGE